MSQSSIYGSYHVQGPNSSASVHNLHNYFINTVAYSLIWSHDTVDTSTKVTVIPKFSDCLRDRDAIFAHFVTSRKQHMDLIDHPQFISFICGVELVLWLDEYTRREHPTIRDIETRTGHGNWKTPGKAQLGTEELAELSKQTGAILSRLVSVARHIYIAKSFFEDITLPPQSAAELRPSSEIKISEASVLLRCQLNSAELYTSYHQERVRIQQSVISPSSSPTFRSIPNQAKIFNLLSREDTNTNTAIAIATKKDGSAMKTIAVMTMAFLPATFFAALFVIPLLQ